MIDISGPEKGKKIYHTGIIVQLRFKLGMTVPFRCPAARCGNQRSPSDSKNIHYRCGQRTSHSVNALSERLVIVASVIYWHI
ncbi:hypothetical protein RCN18_22570, partial [Escherichia marmotae]|nr:hypothetical protein [Escherichia marmotae]